MLVNRIECHIMWQRGSEFVSCLRRLHIAVAHTLCTRPYIRCNNPNQKLELFKQHAHRCARLSVAQVNPVSSDRSPPIIRTKRSRVAAAPPHPLPPSCPSQTLATAPRLGQSARTHRVSGGIQASNSFTKGGSAVRTEQTRQRQKLNQNQSGRGVGGRGLGSGGLHSVPRINTLRIVPSCRRFDCIRCSMRALVMPHSATSSASGDEISTTISWNSGV